MILFSMPLGGSHQSPPLPVRVPNEAGAVEWQPYFQGEYLKPSLLWQVHSVMYFVQLRNYPLIMAVINEIKAELHYVHDIIYILG